MLAAAEFPQAPEIISSQGMGAPYALAFNWPSLHPRLQRRDGGLCRGAYLKQANSKAGLVTGEGDVQPGILLVHRKL